MLHRDNYLNQPGDVLPDYLAARLMKSRFCLVARGADSEISFRDGLVLKLRSNHEKRNGSERNKSREIKE